MKLPLTAVRPVPAVEEPGESRSSRWRSPTDARAGAIATVAALLVYVVAAVVEIGAIEVLRPSELELTWISDAVLALAFGVAVFLWLHLRWTRRTLSRLERERIILDAQLSLAAEIQRALLPPLPPDGEGLRWAARLVEAWRVGGDLYDFVRVSPGSWLVLVGDVSGKGIPAALVMTSIRSMFRGMTTETRDPGELVARVSQRLHEDHRGMPYLTCVLVRIDVERRELSFVNAGHPTCVVVERPGGKGVPRLLASSGLPAGLFPNQKYQTGTISLPEGGVCVLVSDGITDAIDLLGVEAASPADALIALLPDPPDPARVCDTLIERTTPAMKPGEWEDDRTVVAFALDG